MTYIKPETVNSPKALVSKVKILHNNGDWSAAELLWDGKPTLGIRWNGSDDEQGCGSPNSRGIPTWFLIPNELVAAIKSAFPEKTDLELAYEAMANDTERENEALTWSNALIGDDDATR